MAAVTQIETVKVIDPRIEPQKPPVYEMPEGPIQNQYYQIAASSIGQRTINFNNLTTLGADRAYTDTFEIEVTAKITFVRDREHFPASPDPDLWTFRAFPLNSITDTARGNINGGTFFSQPMSYLNPKMRYWNQKKIQESFANHTPCCKPMTPNEFGWFPIGGSNPAGAGLTDNADALRAISGFNRTRMARTPKLHPTLSSTRLKVTKDGSNVNVTAVDFDRDHNHWAYPSPSGATAWYYGDGLQASNNSSIVDMSPNMYPDPRKTNNNEFVVYVRWREPIFCSPFSSRIDETWGRPLYNITSMDITLELGDLKNMILCRDMGVTSYGVEIQGAMLCYQVMTAPSSIPHDIVTVPYRRFVPFITLDPQAAGDQTNPANANNRSLGASADAEDYTVTLTSGVYTWNEVPTAVWIFVAPEKDELASFHADFTGGKNQAGDADYKFNVGIHNDATKVSNFNFAFIESIDLNCANTTQILATAKPHDLYRLAKANGCQDSFSDWSRAHPYIPGMSFENPTSTGDTGTANTGLSAGDPLGYIPNEAFGNQPLPASLARLTPGMGSVLRLVPGTDIVIPGQKLVPGANAENAVFQARVKCTYRNFTGRNVKLALWLLFEYVGVAAITPGNCSITMNPLGDLGTIPTSSLPVVSGADVMSTDPSTVEGSGFWDKFRRILERLGHWAIDNKVPSKVANAVGREDIGKVLGSVGLGEPQAKKGRKRTSGGAIMGLGDFC